MNWSLLILASSLVLFGILEYKFPFFTYKLSWSNRVATNFSLAILNSLLKGLLLLSLLKWVYEHNTGLFNSIPSPWVEGLLSILMLDSYRYGWHVLMHKLPIGWRFHRVHHTDRAMNISTAYRFHFVEAFISYFPMFFLIWLFGLHPIYVFIYESLFVIDEVFQHSNWALPLKVDRILSYVVVTPNCHRVHHSQVVKETDSNYGSLLTIWDRLFGTFRYSRAPKTIKIGLREEPRHLNILDSLALPFVFPRQNTKTNLSP
jgi:sterol desaturase/sphingolipid hydroxylase (fatty acid hydroxylase superfamily)